MSPRPHYLICGIFLLTLVAICLPSLGLVWEMLAPAVGGTGLLIAWAALKATD